jgi:hypothetical protein
MRSGLGHLGGKEAGAQHRVENQMSKVMAQVSGCVLRLNRLAAELRDGWLERLPQ